MNYRSTRTSRLTTRQYRLYDFIKAGNGARFSKRDIYENVDGYEWHENASDKCPSIRTDMKAINASNELDAVIVFDHQMYYWATAEEIETFINRKKKTISIANKEIYVLKKKLAKHGQGKLLNNQLNPMKPSDKEVHEVYRD